MSSYYIPLPAAEYPRNALLDFSPIRQAIMDRRNAEQQAYERQRQNMMDERSLANTQYERMRQSEADNMARTKFAWETEDRNKPKLTEFDGNVGLYNPKTQSLSFLYKKENYFNDMFGGGNTPTNALSQQSVDNSQISQPNAVNNFAPQPMTARPSFNSMTGTNQIRPMNGMVVDEPNQPIQQRMPQQTIQPSQPQQKTMRIGNRDVTRDQIQELLRHPDAGVREYAKSKLTDFDAMGGTSLEKSVKGNLQEKATNAQIGWGMLNDIKEKFDPKYLTGSEQLKNYARGWRAYLTGTLPPDQVEDYQNYVTWRQDTLDLVNTSIKAITGASMSVQEADRIIASLPSDKDDPIAFQAKLDNAMKKVRMSILKFNYMLKNGLDYSPEELQFKVNNQNLKEYRRNRQIELTNELATQANVDPRDPAIQEQVKQRIMSEFEGLN